MCKAKKVLITGGAGYIGSVMSGVLLNAGYQVIVVDPLWFDKTTPEIYKANPNYEFIQCYADDQSVIDYIKSGKVDYVVHAAAVVGEPASKKFPELTVKINYETSCKLADASEIGKVEGFIFFSTCSNYGVTQGMANEESFLNPLSIYAKTKVDSERFISSKNKRLNWVICRLATVYGVSPRMRFDLTVNSFTMLAFTRKYLDIFLPESYRPYIHVMDIACVIRELIANFKNIKNNVFNIGFEGQNYKKIEIAEAVRNIMPETKIEIVKSGIDLRDYRVDFSKLKSLLNLKNTVRLEDGIKKIIETLDNGMIKDPSQDCFHNTMPNITEGLGTDAHRIRCT